MDKSSLQSRSCFIQGSFTCAFTQARAALSTGIQSRVTHGTLLDYPAAVRARLMAAFKSRSVTDPQSSHLKIRSARVRSSSIQPHQEQVLLDGSQRETVDTREPACWVLYASCRRNSEKPTSAMDRESLRFLSIPRILRSSRTMHVGRS